MLNGQRISLALVLLMAWHCCLWAGEPRREAIHRRAKGEWPEKEPEWKQELRRKLQEKVSFEFIETPLSQALQRLADRVNVNIILDLRQEGRDTPITLKVDKMKLKLVLEWLLTLSDLDYALQDEAIFVSVPEELKGDLLLRIYDVRDMNTPPTDRAAPRVDLAGSVLPERESRRLRFAGELEIDVLSASSLAEMIQTRVRPDMWAAELGTSIEEREGRLVVMQRPGIHREIEELLRKLRKARSLLVRVEAQLLAVPEDLLTELHKIQEPGEGTVYLKHPQLSLLAKALNDQGAELVGAARLSCLNGQRSHTLAGKTLEQKGDKRLLQFRGTILDVRPMISFDKKYVTMHLRLTRIERSERPGETVQVFKFSTTVSCLETDTVLLAGASLPDGRRLVALVTPTILHLEPAPQE